MSHSLLHIIEVGSRGVADLLSLPVGEGIDHQELDTTGDESVGGAIGVLVPRVGGTDQSIGEGALHIIDFREEGGTGQGAAVEGLRADSDGVDLVFIARNGGLESGLVGCVRSVGVGPEIVLDSCSCLLKSDYTHQTPRTTWKPLVFAAGRMAAALEQSLAEYVRTRVVVPARASKSDSKSLAVLQLPSGFISPRAKPKVPAAETANGAAARANETAVE